MNDKPNRVRGRWYRYTVTFQWKVGADTCGSTKQLDFKFGECTDEQLKAKAYREAGVPAGTTPVILFSSTDPCIFVETPE